MSDERSARLQLARLAEPGDAALTRVLAQYGAVELLDRIRSRDRSLRQVDDWRVRLSHDIADDLQSLERVDGRFVIPADDEWPTQLSAPGIDPPVGLFVVGGDLRLAAVRSVAVVGSRAATSYGMHVASEIGSELAEQRWVVVSGGAYGIDAAAHRGALVVGGTTVGVLACGVDVRYPRGNATLLDRIVETGGCLVSELPPGSHPTRPRFLQRNRVIAGLARATVVVEAAQRSGALNTATYCRRLGRPLLAVPGPVTSPMSFGCHRLLRDLEPARLVTGAAEIIEEVGVIGDLAPLPTVVERVRDSLDPTTRRVLEAVPTIDPLDTAEIATGAGLAHGTVAGALLRLAAAGLVRHLPDRGFILVPGAGDQPRPSATA